MSSQGNLKLRFGNSDGDQSVPLVDKLLIGRHPGCQIVLAESSVSSKHAAVIAKGDRWFIADLDSSNGIVSDGQKVKQLQLKDGVQFRIGATAFTVTGATSASSNKAASGAAPKVTSSSAGGDLVIRRSSSGDQLTTGGSVALQTLVFIGILGILFYSSFDLLNNLASDPNAMEIQGDILVGFGAFEVPESASKFIPLGKDVEANLQSGDAAPQGGSWLEALGEPGADGSLRMLWEDQFLVEAGSGILMTASMKAVGFDRFGLSVRWSTNSTDESILISEDYAVVKPRSTWSRIALESPVPVGEKFYTATISIVGFSDRGGRGSLSVDQWVAKRVEMEPASGISLVSLSDQQQVGLQLDDRGVGQVTKDRLEMVSDLRMSLGTVSDRSPWGQLLPSRKEPFLVGEDGSFRMGFELDEMGESAVIQQFVRPQNQRLDMSWTVQRSVPALTAFRVKEKRLSLPLSGYMNGMLKLAGLEGDSFSFVGDEFALGEGSQQVVLILSRPAEWSGYRDSAGDLVVVINHGLLEAGGLVDLSISASSAREKETLDRIVQELDLLLDQRSFGEASQRLASAREQLGWRDDLESRLSSYDVRISDEISAVESQLQAVQEDIRRYPGSPAEGFLIEICTDAKLRFKGLAVETQAVRILNEIESQNSIQEEKAVLGKVQTLLLLAQKATDEERGELARFYYEHVLANSPGTDAAKEAEQGLKIIEAKGI